MIGPFQEADGAVSMRRILAAICFPIAGFLYALAFQFSAAGWAVFIPGTTFLLAGLVLLFFTTWADVAQIVKAAKGE